MNDFNHLLADTNLPLHLYIQRGTCWTWIGEESLIPASRPQSKRTPPSPPALQWARPLPLQSGTIPWVGGILWSSSSYWSLLEMVKREVRLDNWSWALLGNKTSPISGCRLPSLSPWGEEIVSHVDHMWVVSVLCWPHVGGKCLMLTTCGW